MRFWRARPRERTGRFEALSLYLFVTISARKRKTMVLHSVAVPVHARVLQHTRHEIIHNRGYTLLAAEAIKQCEFAFSLRRLVGAAGPLGAALLGFLDTFFTAALAGAGE